MYRDFVFALDCLLLLKELYYTLTHYETNPKPYWYKITMLIMLGWDVPGSSVHADLIPGRGTEIPQAARRSQKRKKPPQKSKTKLAATSDFFQSLLRILIYGLLTPRQLSDI